MNNYTNWWNWSSNSEKKLLQQWKEYYYTIEKNKTPAPSKSMSDFSESEKQKRKRGFPRCKLFTATAAATTTPLGDVLIAISECKCIATAFESAQLQLCAMWKWNVKSKESEMSCGETK